MNVVSKHFKSIARLLIVALLIVGLAVSATPSKAQAPIAAGSLSSVPSSTIGTIGALAPDPGKPIWDGADRANDVAFFGDRYAIVVGKFEKYIKGTNSYNRKGLVIIDMLTGTPTNVSLPITGEVLTVKISPTGTAAYIGGNFDINVGGERRHNAAKIMLSTGELTAWNPQVNGVVQDIDIAGAKRNRIVLAGNFTTVGGTARASFASVNATSGALTNWLRVRLSGGEAGKLPFGYNIVTNSDGTKLVGTGNFSKVNDKAHWRVFVMEAKAKKAVLTPWKTTYTRHKCSPNKDHEELGAVFSGKHKLGLATTGGHVKGSICDSVSVWNLKNTNAANAKPLWLNYTQKDSMSGVAFFRGYTYGAGHNKSCAAQPGSSVFYERPGLCEYDAKTGKLTSWNPTTSRQRSMHVRLVGTPASFQVQGLFYVGDANKIGGQDRNNIAFFPVK